MKPNYMKPIGLSNSARLNINNNTNNTINIITKPSSARVANTEVTVSTDPAPSTLLQLSKDALMRRVRDLQNENRALLRELEVMKKQREDDNGNRATRQRSSSAPVSLSNSPFSSSSLKQSNKNNSNSDKENKENMMKNVRSVNESTSNYSVDLESSPDEPASCMRRVQSNLNESHTCARETFTNNNKNQSTENTTVTSVHVDPEGEMTVRGSVDLNNEYYLRESIQLAEHTRQMTRRSSCLLSPERDRQSTNNNNK